MNYQIIKDEDLLRWFIEWLPELKENETFYVCLFARSKYTKNEAGENGIPHIKSDKAQLKRFTSKKEDLFTKIKQLECPIGSYQQKGGIIVPQEALALYITPNPRDMYRAMFSSIRHLTTCIQNTNKNVNPHQEVMSEIQRTKSRTCFVDFDIDDKSVNLQEELKSIINPGAYEILETRGGYHLLVKPDKVNLEYKKTWHQNISKIGAVDQTGDQMIPVPGCSQGGFTPKFV